jgi:hypothetical protein
MIYPMIDVSNGSGDAPSLFKLFIINLPFSFTGANILQVLNQNSQLVAQEFGGPILEYAIDYAMNVTQRFFSAYTYEQISHVPITDEFFEKE